MKIDELELTYNPAPSKPDSCCGLKEVPNCPDVFLRAGPDGAEYVKLTEDGRLVPYDEWLADGRYGFYFGE